MPSDAPPISQALNDGTVDDLTSASLRSSKTAAAGRTFASSRSKRPTSPTCVTVFSKSIDTRPERIQRVDASPVSHRMFDRPQYPQMRVVESLRT